MYSLNLESKGSKLAVVSPGSRRAPHCVEMSRSDIVPVTNMDSLLSYVYLHVRVSNPAVWTGNHNYNKAIRDGRPRPPRHQVGWDIVRRECACQIS